MRNLQHLYIKNYQTTRQQGWIYQHLVYDMVKIKFRLSNEKGRLVATESSDRNAKLHGYPKRHEYLTYLHGVAYSLKCYDYIIDMG